MFQESGSDWCWKSVPGIVSFSNMRQKPCILQALVIQSCWTLCNPMDCSHQAPLPIRFFRQEYWSKLPFASPGDLPDPEIKPRSLALQADSLPSEPPGKSIHITKELQILGSQKEKSQCYCNSLCNCPIEANTLLPIVIQRITSPQ